MSAFPGIPDELLPLIVRLPTIAAKLMRCSWGLYMAITPQVSNEINEHSGYIKRIVYDNIFMIIGSRGHQIYRNRNVYAGTTNTNCDATFTICGKPAFGSLDTVKVVVREVSGRAATKLFNSLQIRELYKYKQSKTPVFRHFMSNPILEFEAYTEAYSIRIYRKSISIKYDISYHSHVLTKHPESTNSLSGSGCYCYLVEGEVLTSPSAPEIFAPLAEYIDIKYSPVPY